MDPLSALSVAAAVVQFIDFVPRVLFSAGDIYHSAKGLTDENANVEEIYQTLNGLGTQLASLGDENSRITTASSPTGSSKDLEVLRKLSLRCKEDCDTLLEVVQKVAVSTGKHRAWRSLKSAVRGIMDKKKMANLESSIERTRNVLSIQILSILRYGKTKSSSKYTGAIFEVN